MKKHKTAVGFLSPQPYMTLAMEKMSENYDVHVLEPHTWDDEEMDDIAAHCRQNSIVAVGGFAQKDAFHHILINERLGNPVPSRLAFFYCMNKYLMRTLEPDPFFFAPVDPLNESDDQIAAKFKEWPAMLKNTSLSLGKGIYKISSPKELKEVLDAYRKDKELQKLIASQYDSYLKGVDPKKVPETAPPFMVEHLVDMNVSVEYCYEGYITQDGEVVHYALTEEVYFSNHQALGYVTPPISIGRQTSKKIEAWVNVYMGRFAELGYRNQFFNLEFWIMPDGAIRLTEINPRAAHSYHYNYLYSFGNSLYEDNLLLARGDEPSRHNPWNKWCSGADHSYTLIVLITGKDTGHVADILDYEYVEHLEHNEGILIRHNRQREEVLTEHDMTAAGVMLLQIWVVGKTKEDIIRKEHEIRARIYKKPPQDSVYPTYWDI